MSPNVCIVSTLDLDARDLDALDRGAAAIARTVP